MALYIVPTPIGNLKDITLRALEVFKEVDIVASEDTRRTGILLKYYDIPKKPFFSFNDHNAKHRSKQLIEEIKNGKSVALTSDAGTPGISDPGYILIRDALLEGVEVISLPGAVACVTGLVASGFPMDKFFFYGFLPKTSGKKLEALKMSEQFTVVYYESPHRIKKTLELLSKEMPDINACVARELTKKFEEVVRGKPSELLKKEYKGEIVLILSNKQL